MACGKLTTRGFNPTWLRPAIYLTVIHPAAGCTADAPARLPKPDDTTTYSREVMPCRIRPDSVFRRITKEYGSETGRRSGTRSACDRGGLHSSKSERICTSGLPISHKRGGPGLTDPVYSQLFASSYVSKDSSQLITAVKLRAQHLLANTRPGRQTEIQKKGMAGTAKRPVLATLVVSNAKNLSLHFKGTS